MIKSQLTAYSGSSGAGGGVVDVTFDRGLGRPLTFLRESKPDFLTGKSSSDLTTHTQAKKRTKSVIDGL